MTIIVLFLAFIFLVSACGNQADTSSLDSYPKFEITETEVIISEDDTMFPNRILYHDGIAGGEIILTSKVADNLLYVVDPVSYELQGLVKKGNGPHEALMPWDLFGNQDGDVVLHSSVDSKLLTITYSPDEHYAVKNTVTLQEMALRVRVLGEDLLIMPPATPDTRFILMDNNGTTIKSIPFPSVYKNDDRPLVNLEYQCLLGVNKSCNRIVTVGMDTPYIDIYSHEYELLHHINTPPIVESNACCSGLSIGEDRLMTGISRKDGFVSTLIMIGLDGNPIGRIELDTPVMSYSVDWQNNRIYCIVAESFAVICLHF